MLEAIWLYSKHMQNLENLDVFEILITQKLLKCRKDPFLRSSLIFFLASRAKIVISSSLQPHSLLLDACLRLQQVTEFLCKDFFRY